MIWGKPIVWPNVFNRPEVRKGLEDAAKYKPAPEAELAAYRVRLSHGLYDDINGCYLSSSEGGRIASAASGFVVGLFHHVNGSEQLTSSGIIVEHHGIKKILTCTYILGSRSRDADSSLKIDVVLSNGKRVAGSVDFMDEHYNVLIIYAADLQADPDLSAATFDPKSFELGSRVTAVCRYTSGELRASLGQLNVRNDHLEADELLSSSCRISELLCMFIHNTEANLTKICGMYFSRLFAKSKRFGIGGPLIDNSSGLVIGMNIFSRKCFTPFMPSIILLNCLDQLMYLRKILCPWLGLKCRSVNELKIDELEFLFREFNSTTGLVVTEVMKGSLAEESGICVGDVISSCNDTPLNTPAELADILFKMVELPARDGLCCSSETRKESKSVEVAIQRVSTGTQETKRIVVQSCIPPVNNRWPLLPPDYLPPPQSSTPSWPMRILF